VNSAFFWTAASGWLAVLALLAAVAVRLLKLAMSSHYALAAGAIVLASLHGMMPSRPA